MSQNRFFLTAVSLILSDSTLCKVTEEQREATVADAFELLRRRVSARTVECRASRYQSSDTVVGYV